MCTDNEACNAELNRVQQQNKSLQKKLKAMRTDNEACNAELNRVQQQNKSLQKKLKRQAPVQHNAKTQTEPAGSEAEFSVAAQPEQSYVAVVQDAIPDLPFPAYVLMFVVCLGLMGASMPQIIANCVVCLMLAFLIPKCLEDHG